MMKTIRNLLLSLTALFLVSLFAYSASAVLVLQINLEQMVSLADRIFVGKCVSVTDKSQGGKTFQEVTFDIEKKIKGDFSGGQVTFRQIGSSNFLKEEPDSDQKGIRTHNAFEGELPEYRVGEEAVVFLSGESRMGLTAPIGLYQGYFKTMAGKSGEKQVMNRHRNRGLFFGWKKSPTFKALSLSSKEKLLLRSKSGEGLPYEAFVSLVTKLARQE